MEELKEVNGKLKSFFDDRAESFNSRFVERETKAQFLFDLDVVKPGDRVLDIACGTGVLDRLLVKYGAKEVVALDISKKMIEYAKSNNDSKNVTFIETDFYNYNGSDFDLAIIYSAYPHLMDKKKLVQKLYDVLKVGGRFIVIHGAGYKQLNEMHSKLKEEIYLPLKPVIEECEIFKDKFSIDLTVDKEDEYIFSGIKK